MTYCNFHKKIPIKFAQFQAELFDLAWKPFNMGSYGTKVKVAILVHALIKKSVIAQKLPKKIRL